MELPGHDVVHEIGTGIERCLACNVLRMNYKSIFTVTKVRDTKSQ